MAENVYTSIMEHLSGLPDPRILLKTRHRLVDIVTMALRAVLTIVPTANRLFIW